MKKTLFILCSFPLFAQQTANFHTIEKERALGQMLASEMRKQAKPLDDLVADQYVKRIGAQLVANLPAEQLFTYQFEVLLTPDDGEPAALPGGFILIPARWLLAVEDESAFAGMLAHSIAHIALRHGTRQATELRATNMASIPLIFVGGWTGVHAGEMLPRAILPFQRAYELEADTFGIELAARAGYSGEAFRRYVERKYSRAREIESLPKLEERLASIDKIIDSVVVAPPGSTEDHLRIREHLKNALPQPEERRPPTLRR